MVSAINERRHRLSPTTGADPVVRRSDALLTDTCKVDRDLNQVLYDFVNVAYVAITSMISAILDVLVYGRRNINSRTSSKNTLQRYEQKI